MMIMLWPLLILSVASPVSSGAHRIILICLFYAIFCCIWLCCHRRYNWQAIKQGLSHVQVSDASSNDEDDDDDQSDGGGDESDGYGDEGLSWEAVMQGLQTSKAGK